MAAGVLGHSQMLVDTVAMDMENAVLAEPHSVKLWLALCRHYSTLAFKAQSNSGAGGGDAISHHELVIRSFNVVNEAYERALTQNTYSYKLWVTYIPARTVQAEYLAREVSTEFDPFPSLSRLHLRAIASLPMMPVLRRMHVELCMQYRRYHEAAMFAFTHLKGLPFTQHPHIWTAMRKWIPLAPQMDFSAARKIWLTMLLVDKSLTAKMEFITFLVEREQFKELLAYCCTLVSSSAAKGPTKRSRAGDTGDRLLREPELWNVVAQVLGKPPLHEEEEEQGADTRALEDDAVEALVVTGCSSCPESKSSLIHGLAVYLGHRGKFAAARKHLRNLMTAAVDPDEYQSAFRVNLAFEQSLAEHMCLTTGSLPREELAALYDTLYLPPSAPAAAASPLPPSSAAGQIPAPTAELKKLVHNHGLELNAVQILASPHVVALWLKRVELLRERATLFEGAGGDEYRASLTADIADVFEQAVAYACSRSAIERNEASRDHTTEEEGAAEKVQEKEDGDEGGSRRQRDRSHVKKKKLLLLSQSNFSAVEIFAAFGLFLLREAGDNSRAVSVLKCGALFTPFPRIEDNVAVLGLLLEAMYMSDKRQLAAFIQSYFIEGGAQQRGGASGTAASEGGKPGRRLSFFVESRSHGDDAELWKSPAAWQLAADWSNQLGQADKTRLVYGAMISAGCYTPETSVVRSRRLYSSGRYCEAFAVMEEAAQLFASDASSALIVQTVYLAMFVGCPDVDPQQRIERIREIAAGLLKAASDDEVARMATRDAANAFLKCAEIELRFGLVASGVAILRRGVEVITKCSAGPAREQYCSVLIDSLVSSVLAHEGVQRARKEFDAILQRGLPTVRLVGEVALRYAALESQLKAFDRARKIFVACSGKQHPATRSGEVFWATWERFEAAHGDAETFEESQRLKRNVVARFSKQQVVFNTTVDRQQHQDNQAAAAAKAAAPGIAS